MQKSVIVIENNIFIDIFNHQISMFQFDLLWSLSAIYRIILSRNIAFLLIENHLFYGKS